MSEGTYLTERDRAGLEKAAELVREAMTAANVAPSAGDTSMLHGCLERAFLRAPDAESVIASVLAGAERLRLRPSSGAGAGAEDVGADLDPGGLDLAALRSLEPEERLLAGVRGLVPFLQSARDGCGEGEAAEAALMAVAMRCGLAHGCGLGDPGLLPAWFDELGPVVLEGVR